jgi:hypothetical protein
VVGGVVLAVLVVVGGAPTLRFMGLLPHHARRFPVAQWEVVSLSADRRSVQIRVDECGAVYDGTLATKVGHNVRLTVYERDDNERGEPACLNIPFDRMPTHIVMLGFMLPKSGHVLRAGG